MTFRWDEPLYLNIGAGPQSYQGFISLDFDPNNNPDIIHDLAEPLPYPDNAAEIIFASHVIEHFPKWQIQSLLQDWCRVLKRQTGLFYGFVPDGKRVAETYLEAVRTNDRHTKLVMVTNMAGGWTNNQYIGPGQVHHYLYDRDSLMETLSHGGFHPVHVMEQEAGPLDYRLVFACGKGYYEPADINSIGIQIDVPWRPKKAAE